MKKIVLFWEERFNNNKFNDLKITRNLSPFNKLTQINGLNNTLSYNLLKNKENFLILCFLTFGLFSISKYIQLFFKNSSNKKYLFLFEPKVISPISYNKIIHLFFNKIYTWNDDLVDNKKYFKFIWPQSFHSNLRAKQFNSKKFLTLINGNKTSFIKNELYSEREKAIRYFENNDIEFNLYGTNWNQKNIKQKIFGFKKYTSYRGRVDDKIETLSNYKFNICFENMKNTPGYITEKIWDSFKAKSVPIYWGASNIEKYIPNNCFVDFRIFNGDYKKLLDFINNIDEKEYNKYISNIEKFLKTEKAKKWFDEKWANDFLNNLK